MSEKYKTAEKFGGLNEEMVESYRATMPAETTVRVEFEGYEELYKTLAEEAKKDFRTLSGQILYRLSQK